MSDVSRETWEPPTHVVDVVWCPYCDEHIGYPCVTASGKKSRVTHQARLIASGGPICVECGNDLVCEGYTMCSECLESS